MFAFKSRVLLQIQSGFSLAVKDKANTLASANRVKWGQESL